MRIQIFDVEHGQCAMVHCPNGKKIMIDAGHNKTNPWRPSIHFYGQDIERLIISNYDEDHVSDIRNVFQNCNVESVYWNRSVNSSGLCALKGNFFSMGKGIQEVYTSMTFAEREPSPLVALPYLDGVEVAHYWNPHGTFNDTNNISVATFFYYKGFTILFPGDIEIAGWKELLKNPNFRKDLSKVTVLVASHHGREDGYCEEVFNSCTPNAVIISDGGIQYSTQEKTTGLYRNKALGCITTKKDTRYVLTTRHDGYILISVYSNGNWDIETAK